MRVNGGTDKTVTWTVIQTDSVKYPHLTIANDLIIIEYAPGMIEAVINIKATVNQPDFGSNVYTFKIIVKATGIKLGNFNE